MHAPLVAGLGMAYFTVSTGTMWTGILIHFLNNLVYMLYNHLYEYAPSFAGRFFSALQALSLVGGASALLLFWRLGKASPHKIHRLRPSRPMPFNKAFHYFVNVPTLLALLYLFWVTSHSVQLNG
jgi:hypothetical protein